MRIFYLPLQATPPHTAFRTVGLIRLAPLVHLAALRAATAAFFIFLTVGVSTLVTGVFTNIYGHMTTINLNGSTFCKATATFFRPDSSISW